MMIRACRSIHVAGAADRTRITINKEHSEKTVIFILRIRNLFTNKEHSESRHKGVSSCKTP